VTIASSDASVLFARSRPVRTVGRDVRALIADLMVTMRRARGVGIAAPQIGVPARVLIAGTGAEVVALVNPRVRRRWGSQLGPEGCLSMPGIVADVPRAFGVIVDALSANGRRMRVRATGFTSRVLQHEIDHLDGILFLDRLAGAAVARAKDGAHPVVRGGRARRIARPRR
jgi:peptide deformylase